MSPAARPQGIGGGKTVRPSLPQAPPMMATPTPPVELSRISSGDQELAVLLNMEPHEVNLMWRYAQTCTDNEVVLGHIKRLFASIKLTDENYPRAAANIARTIEQHHAEVRRIEAMNANSMKRFADEFETFEKDSNEEFHAVNRAYLEFMRALKRGLEWDRIEPVKRELMQKIQATYPGVNIVRYRSKFWFNRMVRLDSDIPKLSQTTSFYGWARNLLDSNA